MSYPSPAYRGDTGEVSGRFRPAGAAREIDNAGGGAAYLATGASTGGHFGLYRWDTSAGPGGPDAHFHRRISESFFVLSGTVRLYDGASWVDAVAGDFLFVPEGGIHAFKNESGSPASMLILFAPGAPREDYFETLADAARRAAMDQQQWAEFYDRHDTHWV